MLPTSPKRTPKIESLNIDSLISSTQTALLLENDERIEEQLQLELTRCKSFLDSFPESCQSLAKLYLTDVYRRKIISEFNLDIVTKNFASIKATFEKAWAKQLFIYETALAKMEHKYEVALKEQKDKYEVALKEQKDKFESEQLEHFLNLDSPLFYRNLIEELEEKYLDQAARENSTRKMRWRTIINTNNFDSLRKLILAYGISLMEFPRYVCEAFDDCSFTIHSYCKRFPRDLNGLKRRYRLNRYTLCFGKVAKVAEILQECAKLKLSPESSIFHAPQPHASRKVSSNVSHSKSRSSSSSSSAISVSDEGECRDARALRRDGSASLSSSGGSTSSSSENLRSLKNRRLSPSKLHSVAAETKPTNSGIKKSAHTLVASKSSALEKTEEHDQYKKCDEDASGSHGSKSLREAALSSRKRQHEESSSEGSDTKLKKLKKRRKKKLTHSHSRHSRHNH